MRDDERFITWVDVNLAHCGSGSVMTRTKPLLANKRTAKQCQLS